MIVQKCFLTNIKTLQLKTTFLQLIKNLRYDLCVKIVKIFYEVKMRPQYIFWKVIYKEKWI